MEIFCVLGIVLLVVMLLGHGMWVVVAWVFRTIGGAASEPSRLCPQCGRYGLQKGRCVVCGDVPHLVPGPRTLYDETKIAIAQLERLAERGAIEGSECARIAALLRDEIREATKVEPVLGSNPLSEHREPIVQPASTRREPPALSPIAEADTPQGAPQRGFVPAADRVVQLAASAGDDAIVDAVLAHPLDRPMAPAAPQPPPAPRRSLADVLQSFMEESNIRWGEILAAMLVVLCSVGLVISLRSTLQEIPYFPAILFTLFTVSFHGAGLYTLRQWNLQAVSRVILIISLLLVPLTFCGAIALQQSQPSSLPLFALAVLAGAGIFTWVGFTASRALIGRWAWPLTLGVVGPSLAQILVQHSPLADGGAWRMNAVFALPLTCFLTATGVHLAHAARRDKLAKRRVVELLQVLGIAGFALLVLIAVLVLRVGPSLAVLARLSPMLCLAAAAPLAVGVVIQNRTTARQLAGWQTAGMAIAVLAAIVMLGFVALTWPEPELLLASGFISGAALLALAAGGQTPVLYVPGVLCAALALTVGMHLIGGQFADRERLLLRIIEAGVMGRSAVLLAALAASIAAAARWFATRERAADAFMLLISSGCLAALVLGITLFSGFVPVPGWQQDRDLAAATLLVLAIGLIAAGPATKRPEVGSIGSFVGWLAAIQALVFNTTFRGWLDGLGLLPERTVLTATLVHGALTALVAALILGRRIAADPVEFASVQSQSLWRCVIEPLASAAAVSLVLATPFILLVRDGNFTASATMALVAVAGWALITAAVRWPGAVSGAQTLAAFAIGLFIAGKWYAENGSDWVWQPAHLYSQALALAAASIPWNIVRRLTSRQTVFSGLLDPPWPAVDRVLLGLASVAMPIVAIGMVWRAMLRELGAAGVAAEAAGAISDLALSWAWLALAAVLVALLVSLWERVTLAALIGVGIATFAGVWIAAGHFEASLAVTAGARWAASLYALLWAALYIGREPIVLAARRVSLLRWEEHRPEAKSWFRAQPLLFGGVATLALTIFAVQQHLAGANVQEPAIGSMFALLGPTASYAMPLVAVVAVLLAYAVRERQAGYALAGAGVWQLAINLAYLLHVDSSLSDAARTILWLHWNSIAAAGYSLLWVMLGRWITPPALPKSEQKFAEALWLIPVAIATVAVVVLVGWAAVAIVAAPGAPTAELSRLGSLQSYLAIGLLLVAIVSRARGQLAEGRTGDAAIWLAAAAVPLVGATIHQFDTGGQWLAFHALEAGWALVALIGCVLVCLVSRTKPERPISGLTPHHLSVAVISLLAVTLAVRGNKVDPGQPWWSLGGVLVAAGTATALGLVRRSQPYAYVSTLTAGLAVALVWMAPAADPYITAVFNRDPYTWFAGGELIVLAVMGMSGFWLSRETAAQTRYDRTFDARTYLPSVHAVAVVLILPIYSLYRAGFAAFAREPLAPAYEAVSILTVLTIGGMLAASLWDRRARFVWPAGYVWLFVVWLLAIGLLRTFITNRYETAVAFLLAAAGQVAVAGHLWSYGANLAAWGMRRGISDPVGGLARIDRWLPGMNIALTAIVTILCLGPVLTFPELSTRAIAALVPAIAAWGLMCLAQGRRRDALQLASLLLAGSTAVCLAWAQVGPQEPAAWMTRIFRLFMVLGALTLAYGLILPRLLLTAGSWNAATRKAGHLAGAAALAAFCGTLALELQLYWIGRQSAIADTQVLAIAVVLGGLIVGLVSLALLPGRDPLVLTERGRQAYVYAAESCAALLFAHFYVCRPEWFGLLRPNWPFVVMAIAFAGLGAAEILERRKVRVLSEPLLRTGSLLPLLPVIGWWVAGYEVDYSLVLLITGLLYLCLSYTRRSWAAMVAATMAGNGALWALLSDSNLALAANPQLWLIPPAVSVLIAAQLNRRRLAPEALAAIRYGASIVIYISSTSEIFTRGFSAGVWPPMVLLGLAVGGALVGIALQVRAFLHLGTLFTLVALIAMVRHAARSIDHVWPWWVFGIALGVAVLVLFGIFEKKRAEMTLLIARLRQWEH